MTIEATEGGGFVVTGEHDIKLYQALAVKSVLALELKGISMGKKGAAARATARGVFGCTAKTSARLMVQMIEVCNKMAESRSQS